MEKKIAFKKGQTVVTINFNSENYFGLSARLYELTVTSEEELKERIREKIESNIDIGDLYDLSINELVDLQVSHVMEYPDYYHDYYNDSLSGTTHGDDLVEMNSIAWGQCSKRLLDLLPSNQDIKELVSIWYQYQLKNNVDQSVIDRVNVLLDRLDCGEDERSLSDDIIDDYIQKNVNN
ncbi:hypothetical protein [Limosilactobacillus fermentum]|uniref:hypothetical protein n=1 Tax=Limosilactobacillus fermentum TaxID=1613 RepID=UPI000FECA225|nr:hypothetical protein [Limosilactobacillus fermentum]QAR22353.1 hypothetical protein EQG50_07790 [Limosilactobacillus fermentum]